MAGELEDTDTGLHIIITSVATPIAVALDGRLKEHYLSCETTSKNRLQSTDKARLVSPCQCNLGKALRGLKRNFATLHEEQNFIGQCVVNREFQRHLGEIAFCLDNAIDGEYVGNFHTNEPRRPLQNRRLKELYYVLRERPSDFEDTRILRGNITEELSRLLPLLTWISTFVDTTSSPGLGPSTTGSVPPVTLGLHQGSDMVRGLAERLHRSLHQGWPCRNEHEEGHEGKLGECTRANMRLDPQWLRHGIEDEAFFVMLSIHDTTYQECRIHLGMPRSVGHDELLCLVDYEYSVESCLYLVIDNTDRLWDDDDERLDLQLLASDLPRDHRYELTPLRKILPNLRLNYMRKRYLQLLLARTVLPLLAGPWMENHLSVYDISILCVVHDDQYYPQLDKLFLPSQFGDPLRSAQRPRYGHPFPAIESLGILMAEIELGSQTDRDSQYQKSPREIAKTLLMQCQEKLPETGGVLQAISFCIDTKSFLSHRPRKGDVGLRDEGKFSALYYTSIIRQLEKDLVDGCRWTWDEASWESPRAIDDPDVANRNSFSDARAPSQVQQTSVKRGVDLHTIVEETLNIGVQGSLGNGSCRLESKSVYNARGCVAGNDLIPETDGWFSRLEEMRTVLDRARKEIRKSDVKRLIKVAVLDTGVDMNHSRFKEWRRTGQLDAGLDLISRDQPITDTDGHGTHTCHVLLKTAPNIKLYPIRVFKAREAETSTPSLVAEAIQHAVHKWDVDIVSMSFAFDKDHKVIEDAILHERHCESRKQVLYFAAASNNRVLENEPIGFPARMQDRVVCVFSSTISGQRSDFSPEGIRSQLNFSVIGENIEAAWITTQKDRQRLHTMSGTSCATPIAAGIAALLLDFAKQDTIELRDLSGWNDIKHSLQGLTGMKSVLRRCMTDEEHMDGNYNFLKPWKLLKDEDNVTIAIKIQDALEKRHK